MRVLHVISKLDPRAGGPAVAVVGMATAQAAMGLDVSILATWMQGDSRDAADELRERGVKVELIGPGHGSLARHEDLAKAVAKSVNSTDIVHVQAVWEEIQYQAAYFARRKGVPYIITPHGMLTSWSLRQKRWKKQLYMAWRLKGILRHAAAFHFTTEMEREGSKGLGLGAKSIVEPIGIALEEFESLPPRDAIRKRFPQIGDRPVVMFLGRIHPGKGLEYLAPALAHVKGIEPVLVVVGPDSFGFRATIEQTVKSLGLQDRVIFTGMLGGRDRIEALAGADIFALPSDHENFGLAVIESLAAGTPVIVSTEVGVHRELVAAGVGAAVSRDPIVLGAEITRWLIDGKMREAAAARCRPYVWERYDWKKIAQRWADAYRSLLPVGLNAAGSPAVSPENSTKVAS